LPVPALLTLLSGIRIHSAVLKCSTEQALLRNTILTRVLIVTEVPLPDGLPNPDRWRYIPEGRIKPGNIFERFAISTFILPIFFYEADIGAGGGVSITDIDFREKRRREFAGMYFSYTTEGQHDTG